MRQHVIPVWNLHRPESDYFGDSKLEWQVILRGPVAAVCLFIVKAASQLHCYTKVITLPKFGTLQHYVSFLTIVFVRRADLPKMRYDSIKLRLHCVVVEGLNGR